MAGPVAVYDFTHPECPLEDFKEKLRPIFKKWVFQLEEGDSGYRHYQGRGSLIKKRRLGELLSLLKPVLPELHVSITTTECALNGDNFYVTKLDTKIGGPWCDRDEEVYIPRQYRGLTLYPWQQEVVDSAEIFDPRVVNYVYDPSGCSGKSTVAAICCLKHKGVRIPAVNDHEKLLASVCDILSAKREREPGVIFIDLPRYMDKKRLHGIFSAIEEIKNGHAYDLRYHFKEWWYDSPAVWVFSNAEADVSALSGDRWRFHRIVDRALVPHVPGQED